MSILDSQVELDEAKLKLGAADEEALTRDLVYWSNVEQDHHAEWLALGRQLESIALLHAMAQRWAALHVTELHKRHVERRTKVGGG